MWLAGGGVKPGATVGETDEIGYNPAADPVNVHDLRANVPHLVGIDHTRLTYQFQAREFRLTDVEGVVMKTMLRFFAFLLACLAVILFKYGAAERFSAYIEEVENTADEKRASVAEAYRQSWGIDKWTIASGACGCAAIAFGIVAFKQPKKRPPETG